MDELLDDPELVATIPARDIAILKDSYTKPKFEIMKEYGLASIDALHQSNRRALHRLRQNFNWRRQGKPMTQHSEKPN